uniref:Protein-tyrosine phosphatase n=1 Tax=Caenorhabditis tropicalis TaxID=1561998 RepID=A0A1I7T3F2_9PELO
MPVYNNYSTTSESNEEREEAPRAQAGAVLGIGKKEKKDKKKDKKKEEGDPTNKTNMTPAPPQAHPIVEQWVLRALDTGVEKLRDEFRFLAKYTRSDMTTTVSIANFSTDINVSKNRYQDVPCQDQCIVILEKPPSPSTYIHANYVGCPMMPEKRFICCQGPLEHTMDEFWWMIIQNKVEQIVMLCKTIETGKLKCAQYWPAVQGEKKDFKSGIVVENVSGPKPMERDAEIQITNLSLSFNGQTMTVRHLHWTDWPDRGVPPCKLTSLELLSAVRGSRVPIVVHCSAGIGRTGTIVAIEYILEKIAENKQCPPMPDLVKQLRDQRAYSIQNDIQYLYIHRVMLHYFLDKYKEKYASLLTPENVAKYEKFVKEYNAIAGQ